MSYYSDQFEPYDQSLPIDGGWYNTNLGRGYACPSCEWRTEAESPVIELVVRGHISAHIADSLTDPREERSERQEAEDDGEMAFSHHFDELDVLSGIAALLKCDRKRAQQLWYPFNEDGTFNR